jgi:GNAT superfamily N-acetyltransferase
VAGRDGGITVEPLEPRSWDCLAALFEQGGDPKSCWCMYWRLAGRDWSPGTEGNRRELRRLVDAGGQPAGLLARRGGDGVGWVSLGPREDFVRLTRSRTIPRLPGEGVWSVVCFAVARRARRTGLAARLLDAAIDHATSAGARILEGYPVRTEGRSITSAAAYTGTLGMFERAGFAAVAPTTSTASGGVPRVVVRRSL